MDRVDEAFTKVDRKAFLPNNVKEDAEFDMPISIGYGQTNSQPYTVRLMLNWLNVHTGDKVLDIGSGSGWTTAMLAHLAGEKGEVYGVELVPELLEFGRKNCESIGLTNVKFFEAGDKFGLEKYAPYDRILVSASAKDVPGELIGQLNLGGKMVIPVGNDILEIKKTASGKLDTITHPGFMFVPLIKKS